MWCQLVLVSVVALFWSSSVSASPDKVVCYFGSWATYRHGNGKFDVENIDPHLCTHAIYSFIGINWDGSVRIMDPNNDINKGALVRFNNLKRINPNLKTLAAIGGWNEGSVVFSYVVSLPNLRRDFINSVINFLHTYKFDGLDLDWEYPAQRGGAHYDKANFATLIAEFRAEFDKYGYLLTAAVAAAGSSVDLSYDVPALSKYLDFINVMAYDLHGSWDGVAGQNAPLYASSIDRTAAQKLLNVDSCIRGWISRGAASRKLILGMGTYGQSYTLSNANNHYLGAPISGAGYAGPYTAQPGMLGYNEICEKTSGGGWSVVWDNEQQVPYAYSGNQWVGYDNARSIEVKVNYLRHLNLGGAMIWSIETDDFRGTCGQKFGILTAINKALGSPGSGLVPSSSTSAASSSSSTTTTTRAPIGDSGFVCPKVGYIRDPHDCSVFYYCVIAGNSIKPTKYKCSPNLVFDTTINVCNYPQNVQC